MPTLYIVATPIGNLEDITLRALRILREVDFILCEDTRVTKRLLDKYEIKTATLSYHHHSGDAKVEKIIELLKQGKNLALVTDAGTPGISDPGNKLIAAILETRLIPSLQITPIPGPAAVTAALSIAGEPTDEFLFLGFLPHKKGRETLIKEIIASKRTAVLYESPHRIFKFLDQLIKLGGEEKKLVVCRELTKMHESIYRGRATEILNFLQKDSNNQKGEFTVIVGK
ncbi:MAG: 16S rRNA (cytidine(1402)-2'-O)-methyltransferase [bacterium]|nr:16S rRNA (cytidine(1402)-2'-O)-methyltransferase [bacterium]